MSEQKAISAFKEALSILYGDRLHGVFLFGSWARGEADADSDIDLLVVLDGRMQPGKEIDRMIDIITDINLEYGVLLAIQPVSAADFTAADSPLLINIRREGVPA